jgi:hypothetical protein
VRAISQVLGYVADLRCGSTDLLRDDFTLAPGASLPPIEVTVRNSAGPAASRQEPPPAPRIAGVVVDASKGTTVAHTEVSVSLGEDQAATSATDDRRFAFDGLKPGKKYRLFATAGYVKGNYNQHWFPSAKQEFLFPHSFRRTAPSRFPLCRPALIEVKYSGMPCKAETMSERFPQQSECIRRQVGDRKLLRHPTHGHDGTGPGPGDRRRTTRRQTASKE